MAVASTPMGAGAGYALPSGYPDLLDTLPSDTLLPWIPYPCQDTLVISTLTPDTLTLDTLPWHLPPGYKTPRYPIPWIPYSPGYHTPCIPYPCPDTLVISTLTPDTLTLNTLPWYLPPGYPTPDTLPPGRNLVSGIPYHHKGHGARDTLPPGKDMGPVTRKEPGTRDILAPCEQTDTCENITFQLWWVKRENWKIRTIL